MGIKLVVSKEDKKFLNSWATRSFSSRTTFLGVRLNTDDRLEPLNSDCVANSYVTY